MARLRRRCSQHLARSWWLLPPSKRLDSLTLHSPWPLHHHTSRFDSPATMCPNTLSCHRSTQRMNEERPLPQIRCLCEAEPPKKRISRLTSSSHLPRVQVSLPHPLPESQPQWQHQRTTASSRTTFSHRLLYSAAALVAPPRPCLTAHVVRRRSPVSPRRLSVACTVALASCPAETRRRFPLVSTSEAMRTAVSELSLAFPAGRAVSCRTVSVLAMTTAVFFSGHLLL